MTGPTGCDFTFPGLLVLISFCVVTGPPHYMKMLLLPSKPVVEEAV